MPDPTPSDAAPNEADLVHLGTCDGPACGADGPRFETETTTAYIDRVNCPGCVDIIEATKRRIASRA